MPMGHHIPIAMNGHIIQVPARFTKQWQSPVLVGSCCRKQFGILCHTSHQFGRFANQWPPFLNTLGSQLMGTPILVSYTPIHYIMRFGIAVGNTFTSKLTYIQIAILYPIAHFFGSACACIGADKRLTPHFTAPFYKLIGTKSIGVFHLPCFIINRSTFFSHSIIPMITGDETSSRPTYDRHLDLFQSLDNVCSESVFICKF